MNAKSNQSTSFKQDLTTCLNQPETTIEFFGIRKNMTTMFFQKGKAKNWNELDKHLFAVMANAYQKDEGAKTFLANLGATYTRQVELFTYFGWGTLDHQPDIIDGVLQPCENFRHSTDCPSVNFHSKKWTLNRTELTPRDLLIIDRIAEERLDTEIAEELGIELSSYNTYKGKLFIRTNTRSRVGLMMAAMREKLLGFSIIER